MPEVGARVHVAVVRPIEASRPSSSSLVCKACSSAARYGDASDLQRFCERVCRLRPSRSCGRVWRLFCEEEEEAVAVAALPVLGGAAAVAHWCLARFAFFAFFTFFTFFTFFALVQFWLLWRLLWE
jgi:hypothetical protein